MTETKEQLICSACKEEIVDDEYTYGNIKEDIVCIYCEESSLESASTLIKVNDEGFVKVRFTDISAYDENLEAPDKWFYELLKDTSKVQSWKSTDAWRGYYSSAENLKLKVVTSGWTTGWADETTTRKIELNNFGELLEQGDLVPPVDLFILIEPTSNLFSTSLDFLVREEDEEELIEWLEVVNYRVEDIDGWLR
jgi:hypothetical protein